MKPFAENDNGYHALKSVAVMCQGFYASAPVVKDKGITWLWLSGDQQNSILRAVPRDYRWRFDDRRISPIAARYPRAFFGFTGEAGECSRSKLGLNGMEDALIDAESLYRELETPLPHGQKLETCVGFRSVFALLQAALGKPLASGDAVILAANAVHPGGA